jgi:hypothetical protein
MESQELKEQMLSKDDYALLQEEYAVAFQQLTDRIADWKQDKRPDAVNTLLDDAVKFIRDMYIHPGYIKSVEHRSPDAERNVDVVTYLTQAQFDAIPLPIRQGLYCITDSDEQDQLDRIIDIRIEIHNENTDAHPDIRTAVSAAAEDAASALHPADVVNDLTSGGSSVPLSAEQGKTLKGMISSIEAYARDRGVVHYALESQADTYRIVSVSITAGGSGYQAGDVLFINGTGLFIPALVIVDAVDGNGAVDAASITAGGSFITDPSGEGLQLKGGHGTGAAFDVAAESGPSSILEDIAVPIISDRATVLQDETHAGETWQWHYVDYNGDGRANWVPDHRIDSELRDFTVDPIAADELGGDAATDAKIGTRTLTDADADGVLISVISKTLTAWLQGIRNNLKYVFNKALFTTDTAGFFKNNGTVGYPTKSDVGLANVDNTSDLNKPVSTAQAGVNESVSGEIADIKEAAETLTEAFGAFKTAQETNNEEQDEAINERVSKSIFADSRGALVADMSVTPEKGSLANIRKSLKNADTGANFDIDVHVISEEGTLESQFTQIDEHNYKLNLDLADDAATDAKIGTRTLTDEDADGSLISIAAKTLTAWLQGIRDNLKYIFNKALFPSTTAGYFKNDGTIGTPSKSDVGLANVDNTSDEDKPVSTAQETAIEGKVAKVEGKGLSANDYTDAEKQDAADILTRPTSLQTTDPPTYLVARIDITAGGAGYAAGDSITVPVSETDGEARGINAVVLAVDENGAVTALSFDNQMIYEADPAVLEAEAYGGSGTGAVCSVRTAYAPGGVQKDGVLKYVPYSDPVVQMSRMRGYVKSYLESSDTAREAFLSSVMRRWSPAFLYGTGDITNHGGAWYTPNGDDMPVYGESPVTHPDKWLSVSGTDDGSGVDEVQVLKNKNRIDALWYEVFGNKDVQFSSHFALDLFSLDGVNLEDGVWNDMRGRVEV